MSKTVTCPECGRDVEVQNFADAITEGWRYASEDRWMCPACAAVDDDLDRQVHEMIEARTGGES